MSTIYLFADAAKGKYAVSVRNDNGRAQPVHTKNLVDTIQTCSLKERAVREIVDLASCSMGWDIKEVDSAKGLKVIDFG